jgi:hypothetical protein
MVKLLICSSYLVAYYHGTIVTQCKLNLSNLAKLLHAYNLSAASRINYPTYGRAVINIEIIFLAPNNLYACRHWMTSYEKKKCDVVSPKT